MNGPHRDDPDFDLYADEMDARAEHELARAEWEAEALAHFDDDPSPYAGTYSEE